MTRILLADDHDVMRRGLRELLEEHAGWEICGEVSDGRQAVEQTKKLRPDIVVLDLGMPKLNGLDAARQIKKAVPRAEVLIFTMHETDQLVRDVFATGALGYVLKSDAARYLITAVERLAAHKPFFSGDIAKRVLEGYLTSSATPSAPSTDRITAREREIVQLLAEGKTNKEAAEILAISVKTVETHRAAIMRKLELASLADLVRYAVRNSIVQP
jgi:DNA-binding NarL/FixJ family response regulator